MKVFRSSNLIFNIIVAVCVLLIILLTTQLVNHGENESEKLRSLDRSTEQIGQKSLRRISNNNFDRKEIAADPVTSIPSGSGSDSDALESVVIPTIIESTNASEVAFKESTVFDNITLTQIESNASNSDPLILHSLILAIGSNGTESTESPTNQSTYVSTINLSKFSAVSESFSNVSLSNQSSTYIPIESRLLNITMVNNFKEHAYSQLVETFHGRLVKSFSSLKSKRQLFVEDPVTLLHASLRNGSDCFSYLPSTENDEYSKISAIQAAIYEFKPKLFVEYTSRSIFQSISSYIAAQHNSLTLLLFSLATFTSELNYVNNCIPDAPDNLLIVDGKENSVLRKFTAYDCVQFIDDLDDISNNLLPFEFESKFGSMLCNCNITYIPKDLPKSSYFSSWETTYSLIRSALEAVDNACSVDYDSTLSTADFYRPLRYSHLLIITNTSLSKFSYLGSLSVDDLIDLEFNRQSKYLIASEWTSFVDQYETNVTLEESLAIAEWRGSSMVVPSKLPIYSARVVDGIASRWFGKHSIGATNNIPSHQVHRSLHFVETQNNLDSSVDDNSGGLSWEFYGESTPQEADLVAEQYRKVLREPPVDVDSSTRTSERNSVSKESRSLVKNLHNLEKPYYLFWCNFILQAVDVKESPVIEKFHSAQSIFLFGRNVGLLSLKLARVLKHPKRQIVSVVSSNQTASAIYELSQMMHLHNLLIMNPRWTLEVITALLAAPERADVIVLQSDMLILAISLSLSESLEEENSTKDICFIQSTRIVELFSIFLSFGRVSFVQLPKFSVFSSTLQFLAPNCAESWIESIFSNEEMFLREALKQITFDFTIKISSLKGVEENPFSSNNVFQIEISAIDLENTLELEFQHKPTTIGLSIYSASWLNIIPQQKKIIVYLLVNLPVWSARSSAVLSQDIKDLGAWNLFIQTHREEVENKYRSKLADSERPNWKIVYYKRSKNVGRDTFVGVSMNSFDSASQLSMGSKLHEVIMHEFSSHPTELADGKFSFIEHDSGIGYLSTKIALQFPNATIFSLEKQQPMVSVHERVLGHLAVYNNPVCLKDSKDSVIFKNLYESPELFRFQVLFRKMLAAFQNSNTLSSWGKKIGLVLSTALTSFVYVPNQALVSWALYIYFHQIYVPNETDVESVSMKVLSGPYRAFTGILGWESTYASHDFVLKLSELSILSGHPQNRFINFPSDWLLSNARAQSGATSLLLSAVSFNSMAARSRHTAMQASYLDFPLVRCDIVNMSRHVHHHYDYARDGHSRTYTMQITINSTLTDHIRQQLGDPSGLSVFTDRQGVHLHLIDHVTSNITESYVLPLGYHPVQHQVFHIGLARDKDNFLIPYISIYGVTLITALRLGLLPSHRDRLFHEFLKLPLYEDMAPWNIVLMGQVRFYVFCFIDDLLCYLER